MNDLKESNETIKQTTDELKKQQDELKNLVDMLNREKQDWVFYMPLFVLLINSFFSRLKNPILKIWKKKFVIYKIYL